MYSFNLFIFALILIGIFAIPVFIVQVVRYKIKDYDLASWFKALATTLDYLGATLIYGTVGHTISAITHKKAINGDRLHIYFEKLINLIFRDNEHCEKAYIKEYL